MDFPPKSPARWAALLTAWFPAWLILGALWAWFQPSAWLWFRPYIEPALGVVMLGMGLTLRFADFAAVLRSPGRIALGVAGQFGIMPLLGWSLARAFHLEPGLALGLILVACCPGGTASNVICHLAHANVPLSVLMTLCSTLAAIFTTPLLTQWLAGAWMPVDASALFRSMLMVVLLPLLAGITLNTLLYRLPRPQSIRRWIDISGPLLSALVVVAIVAYIIAARRAEIAGAAPRLFAAVFLLHAGGFALGYLLGRICGCGPDLRRTLSIEVGMQNSGLGAALAARHFPSLAMAPVPAAISAVFHSLIGSALAAMWRRRAVEKTSHGI